VPAGSGFHDADARPKTQNRFGVHLDKQGAYVRENTELEQTHAHGVERAGGCDRLEGGAVVGMDEEFGEVEPAAALERGQETAPLLGVNAGSSSGLAECVKTPASRRYGAAAIRA